MNTKTKQTIKKLELRGLEDSFKQITSIGSIQIYIIISISFYLLGYIKEATFLIVGLILMYILASPLRLIFFRERPTPKPHSNIIEKILAGSFPSLHATRTIFLILFFNNFYNNILLTTFLIIIGLIILYSRIYRKMHYPSDLIGGIILGIIAYYLLSII